MNISVAVAQRLGPQQAETNAANILSLSSRIVLFILIILAESEAFLKPCIGSDFGLLTDFRFKHDTLNPRGDCRALAPPSPLPYTQTKELREQPCAVL